ncbi:MAG: CCA tRNA nucleotidyltransferase, partial [Gemmatimonadales bacterium]|nr:CCA tRNA nucleotidyltransferase [Gemmatimonadales bacterium]
MTLPQQLNIDEDVVDIVRRLEAAGHETWCVGGAVRDRLIDPAADGYEVDLATAATPGQVQALFRRTIAVGIEHGTVGVLDRGRRLREVTTFRRDVRTDGRHAVVAFGVTLADDLARRDFTINAIAYHPLRTAWCDPFHGADDLERRLVRAVGDPAHRFREDYLRILRALRFAARFDFRIDAATWDAARAAAPGLRQLSAERVRDEWFKGLATARAPVVLASLWRKVGAAEIWLPELLGESEVHGIVPRERDPVLLTAWLTSDPVSVLTGLKGSNAEIARAAALRDGPAAPSGSDDPSLRRWLART